MAKNETTELTLYRVNYQYIAPNAQLRQGAVVVEAKNIEEAKAAAIEKIKGTAHDRGVKIANVKTY